MVLSDCLGCKHLFERAAHPLLDCYLPVQPLLIPILRHAQDGDSKSELGQLGDELTGHNVSRVPELAGPAVCVSVVVKFIATDEVGWVIAFDARNQVDRRGIEAAAGLQPLLVEVVKSDGAVRDCVGQTLESIGAVPGVGQVTLDPSSGASASL